MTVISFPNQEERKLLKRQKFGQKRQNAFNKINGFAKKCFLKIAHGLSLLLANVFHHGTVFFFTYYTSFANQSYLSFMACVSWLIFTANNMSIPVFLLISVLILSSERIADKIAINMPFHRLLRCKIFIEGTEQNRTTKYVLLEYSD